MKMLIAGAGPAGLYLAYLVKRQLPGWSIRIVEQNPRDSTFGFGVVFSDRALEFLRGDDAETFDLITPAMQTWTNLTLVHRGTPLVIDGIGFAAIGRLQLLRLLQQRLASVSVRPEMSSLRNKFCWCGTTKLFPTLTQTFVSNEHGSFNAHHYRHSAGMSTFVVECDPATWGRAGFAAMDEAATLAYCERVFADTLAGHPPRDGGCDRLDEGLV